NCDGKEIPIHQGRSGMIVRAGDGLNVRVTPNGPKIVKTLPGGSSVKCDRRKWYYGVPSCRQFRLGIR
ncbi:MAG: hypothetical protein SOT28_07405, partial [Fusicatenibacter sp.]|nr:hypothetical protein [Fusicatenibacter sp.]